MIIEKIDNIVKIIFSDGTKKSYNMVTKHYVKNGINNEVETNIININGNCISSSNVNTIDGVSITDDNKLFDELEKLL